MINLSIATSNIVKLEKLLICKMINKTDILLGIPDS